MRNGEDKAPAVAPETAYGARRRKKSRIKKPISLASIEMTPPIRHEATSALAKQVFNK